MLYVRAKDFRRVLVQDFTAGSRYLASGSRRASCNTRWSRACCVIATISSVVGLGTLAVGAFAADNRDRFESCVFESGEEGKLPYRLLRPKQCEPGARYPLVLFLHGAGERGDDNRRQLVHGANDFASDEAMQRYPCFFVAPQCPDGQQWVDTPWSADSHVLPPKAAPPLAMSLELLDELQRQLPIDARRLYVTGLSMGGFGVWDALARQPQRFAAAIPICGGGDTATAQAIAGVAVWAFHGGSDSVVQPRRSRDMVQALQQAGGSPKYTEYPGTGHDAWSATYRNPDVMAWLFAQQREQRQP